MMCPDFGWLRLATLVLLVVISGAAHADQRPNLIVVLADDLGWADLPSYGNTFNEAPRLDQMARQGMRFTQFYAGPVCSPTRANLQSGQDQARFGITQHIPGHHRPYAKLLAPAVPLELPLVVETYAERLRDAGYATGYFGKWHLGGAGHGPADQGWNTAEETRGNFIRPANKSDTPKRMAEYLADRAVEFIEQNKDRPFVLQVSHQAVHIPLSSTPDRLAQFEAKQPMPGYPSRADYAGLLHELDTAVGRVIDAVDANDLAEKTLVLFVSDNGGLEHQQDGVVVTSNKPLRGEKGQLYEGGIRVPALARWPGRIPAGTVTDAVATTIDIYPTLMALAGISTSDKQPTDGASLVRVLEDPTARPALDTRYWHLPHYHHSTPASAIRRGDWKLIEFFEDGRLELYNLADDLGETRNVAGQHPETTNQLHAALVAWREKVGARMPTPNPDYDPQRADQLGRRER